jgi:hypothetical protein
VLALELAPAGHQVLGEESTLDELIVSAWEGLSARREVPCPCCGVAMTPQLGATGRTVRGRCSGCGSELA